MIVKLFDRTEIYVSTREGEAVARAMASKKEMIALKGMVIKTSAIAYIKPGGQTQHDIKSLPAPDNRREPSPNKEKMRELFDKGLSWPEIAKLI